MENERNPSFRSVWQRVEKFREFVGRSFIICDAARAQEGEFRLPHRSKQRYFRRFAKNHAKFLPPPWPTFSRNLVNFRPNENSSRYRIRSASFARLKKKKKNSIMLTSSLRYFSHNFFLGQFRRLKRFIWKNGDALSTRKSRDVFAKLAYENARNEFHVRVNRARERRAQFFRKFYARTSASRRNLAINKIAKLCIAR